MNQILSVEMSTKKGGKRKNKKANIKTVIIVFCIILVIFGIAMVGLGIYSFLNKNEDVATPSEDSNKVRIDTIQGSTSLEVSVFAEDGIAKIEYNWNNENTEEITKNGETKETINVNIPSGTNTFSITVTDVTGESKNYTGVYVGTETNPSTQSVKTPNVKSLTQEDNKLIVEIEEEQQISYISYYYDNEKEIQKQINATTGRVEIDVKTGEHDLTIKETLQDGTEKQVTKNISIPDITVYTDYKYFYVTATDNHGITSVKMNFNGEDIDEDFSGTMFDKTLTLTEPTGKANNRLKITVTNIEGFSYTIYRWDKK